MGHLDDIQTALKPLLRVSESNEVPISSHIRRHSHTQLPRRHSDSSKTFKKNP